MKALRTFGKVLLWFFAIIGMFFFLIAIIRFIAAHT
jgi:hypothetical protein